MTGLDTSRHEVLVLCEYPTLNGGERSLLAVLPELAGAGFRISVAAPAHGPLADELARTGVPHLEFSVRDERGATLPREIARFRLAELLAARRPAILHANSLSMGRLSGPVAAELGIASLAHLRDIVGLSAGAVADLNRHARIVAVSRATREFHIAQGLSAEKTVVVYNGVDVAGLARVRPAVIPLREELGWPEDALIAGTIGQIILRKGQDVLARAAAQIAEDETLNRVHWAIVGQRHSQKAETIAFEQAIERTFAEAGLAERVRFLGDRDDVPRLLSEFTFLVHPARQEPLGRVLLEAAAAGLPVLATDVGGTREIFGDDSAVLVPPDDPRALADVMRRLATDESLRARLSAGARTRAISSFDARRAAECLAAEYRTVLAAH